MAITDAHHVLSALANVDLYPVRARMVDSAVDSAAAHCGLAATMALHSRVTPAA